MQKIIVVGSSCSGKTSTGRLIEKHSGIPFIDLDDVFWKPGWQGTDDDEFREKIDKITKNDSWCLSGNYNRINDLTWARADAIVWLNFPFPVVFRQALYRTFKRALTKELVCNGNTESLVKAFFSKDSILWWVYKTYPSMTKRYLDRKKTPLYDNYKFYEFYNHYDVREWIETLRSKK